MKRFFLAAILLIFVVIVKAQETHFGLKGGVNISSLDLSKLDDYDSKVGLHVGGLAHIHISKSFAIQPELYFSTQGGEWKDDAYKLNLNYINFPVLAQLMVNDGFRFETGPQIGFLTSAKYKDDNIEVDRKKEVNSTDFSWAFGIGYLFPQGFGIDARYNLGLNNIREIDDFKMKNRVFQLGLFYQFMHAKPTTRSSTKR